MNLRFYDRLFNVVALTAVAMLFVPLFLIFFGGTVPYSVPIFSFLAVLSVFAGYGLQWGFASLTGKTVSSDGYDDPTRGVLGHFSIAYAAVPILVSLALSAGVFFLYNFILFRMFENGVSLPNGQLIHYTMLYPLLAAVLVLAAAVCGCVVWFYPVERLTSIYLLMGACVLFFLESVALSVTARATQASSGAFVSVNLGVPFAIFFLCVLVIYNQSNLQKKYRGSVVSVITTSERLYNLFLVFLLTLVFAVTVGVVFILLKGLSIIGRMLLFIILFRLFHGEEGGGELGKNYEYYDSDEASNMMRRNVMSPENQYIVAVFFLTILAAGLIVLAWRTGLLKKFWIWLREFIDTVLIGIGIFKISIDPNEDDVAYNYKDEKRKIQKAGIRDLESLAADTDSYRLFMTRLSRLKTYDEQLCFAYAVLLKLYKQMNIPLKHSDTPREVEKKVFRALSEAEISKITADFESIRYAEHEPEDAEAAAILSNICGAVKRYMY